MWSPARVRLPQTEGESPVRLTQGPQRACLRSSLGPSLGPLIPTRTAWSTHISPGGPEHSSACKSTHHHEMVRPPPRGVKGLRRHPRGSQRGIYALSCIRTSENSPSTHSGECTFSEIHLTSEGC